MSWLSKLGKSISKDVKNVGTGVSKAAKSVETAAVKVLKGAGEDVAFAPLLIFKKQMVDELNRRGITTDGSILDIATKFHQNVVKKHS